MKRIAHKYQIFWLLMKNYKEYDNRFTSSGSFCEKDVYMGKYGWQWLSYKGATRISDTVFKELPKNIIEREKFEAISGSEYYKYRLINKFNPNDLPEKYKKFLIEYKAINKK